MMAGAKASDGSATNAETAPPAHPAPQMTGLAGSKYDFVKVRVWLGPNRAHWYTLSRFLISRTLTASRIPQDKAIRISLSVKKQLVDRGLLDINQEELERVLHAMLQKHGCASAGILSRYRTVAGFFQARRPLVIILCGAPGTGKTSIAQQLGARLNLPNVLQTDLLLQALGPELLPDPGPGASLVSQFTSRSRLVRNLLAGDIDKCLKEGKSAIIEGFYLDLNLYLNEFSSSVVLLDAEGTGVVLPPKYAESASGRHGPASDEAGSSPPPSPDTRRLLVVPVVLWAKPEIRPLLPRVADEGDSCRGAGLEIQTHLQRLRDCGVPLIEADPGCYNNAVDALHDHVLACIEACAAHG